MSAERIYLDNAATSWPKPETVYLALDHAQRQIGAAAGRGTYRSSLLAAQVVDEARRAVAELIGSREARQIVFAHNGTDALNMALHGLLGDEPGHVVASVLEHNSVLRPLREWQTRTDGRVTLVGCGPDALLDPQALIAELHEQTRLVVVSHGSNVTGAVQDVATIARAARERGILTLVDAAQTLGKLPLAVDELGCDLLAASGHKGLLGPLGTGILYLRPGIEQRLSSYRQGGTGTRSESDEQPASLPDKFESGNLNVPALAGLAAGVAYLQSQGVAALHTQVVELTTRLCEALRAIEPVRLFGPAERTGHLGIVSFVIEGLSPQETAVALEAGFGIEARAGLHCAPRMHETLGTLATGGTVRLSLGPLTSADEVDRTIAAIRAIAEATALS